VAESLPIAAVSAGAGFGRIGFTRCPGPREPRCRARCLRADIAAIRAWGAGLLVTLMESAELERLGVPDLGDRVRAAGLAWLHLPIADFGVPDAAFEAAWTTAGQALRTRLRAGRDVALHCRGGLGRSGTIAARLLVELGTPPETAIAAVRAARPGAIETVAQAAHVRAAERGTDTNGPVV
jgi:ADP-ribosyl-[dinitrogen reductase] hydrolase